jgi:hypothetical protein
LYEETPVRSATVQLRFTVLPETAEVNVTLGTGAGATFTVALTVLLVARTALVLLSARTW